MKPPVPFEDDPKDDDSNRKPSPEQKWDWECAAELQRMKLWRQVHVALAGKTGAKEEADQAVLDFDQKFMNGD